MLKGGTFVVVLFVVAAVVYFMEGSHGEWQEIRGGTFTTQTKYVNGSWTEIRVYRNDDGRLVAREWVDYAGVVHSELDHDVFPVLSGDDTPQR